METWDLFRQQRRIIEINIKLLTYKRGWLKSGKYVFLLHKLNVFSLIFLVQQIFFIMYMSMIIYFKLAKLKQIMVFVTHYLEKGKSFKRKSILFVSFLKSLVLASLWTEGMGFPDLPGTCTTSRLCSAPGLGCLGSCQLGHQCKGLPSPLELCITSKARVLLLWAETINSRSSHLLKTFINFSGG